MTTPYVSIHARNRRLKAGAARLQHWQVVVFIAAILGLLAYLWQINTLSTRGFKIKSLEKQIGSLKTEIQQLELSSASERSAAKINQRVQELKMVKVEKIEYLQPLGSSMALGR